jgi:intergrase/recombinase
LGPLQDHGSYGSKGTSSIISEFRNQVEQIDWNAYEKWCINNKSRRYAKFLVRGGKKWYQFAFSYDLVEFPNNRTKEDILKAITNLTRYLDIKYDSNFHEQLLYWIKRKEIKWKTRNIIKIPNEVPLNEILENIRKLPEKYKLFAIFSLVSGLRTFESVKVLNNHSHLCRDGIIEMYWDRKTKKANAVYCHPLLHDKMEFSYSENSIHRNLTTKMLGCQIKYLRKINFTKISTDLDPMLANYLQGRKGDISQRHYFLPMMNKHQKKWEIIWQSNIKKLI